jgi:hypothetical protein
MDTGRHDLKVATREVDMNRAAVPTRAVQNVQKDLEYHHSPVGCGPGLLLLRRLRACLADLTLVSPQICP